MQNILDLDDGNSVLKLTVASYYRPSGKNIHRFKNAKDTDEWGVSPDPGLEVKLTTERVRRTGSSAVATATGSSAKGHRKPSPQARSGEGQGSRKQPRRREARPTKKTGKTTAQDEAGSQDVRPFVDKQLDKALESSRWSRRRAQGRRQPKKSSYAIVRPSVASDSPEPDQTGSPSGHRDDLRRDGRGRARRAAAARVGRAARSVRASSPRRSTCTSGYGGVVPEIASRAHVRQILPVIDEALRRAGVDARRLGAVAVATRPGLVGALVVGLTAAKALALALGRSAGRRRPPRRASLRLPARPSRPGRLPVRGPGRLGRPHEPVLSAGARSTSELLGGTTDDAAGEAFDKVASLLGLGYPGGPGDRARGARRQIRRRSPFPGRSCTTSG